MTSLTLRSTAGQRCSRVQRLFRDHQQGKTPEALGPVEYVVGVMGIQEVPQPADRAERISGMDKDQTARAVHCLATAPPWPASGVVPPVPVLARGGWRLRRCFCAIICKAGTFPEGWNVGNQALF
jgi:hypothetical protein